MTEESKPRHSASTESTLPSTLLVADVPPWKHSRLTRVLKSVVAKAARPEAELHVMAFVDQGRNELEAEVRKTWPGPVTMVDSSSSMARVGLAVRRLACEFAADVREKLEAVAAATGGATWARRLGELWWYSEFPEKNTEGGMRPWHELVRLEAIRARLQEGSYHGCVYIGDSAVVGPLRQLCSQAGVPLIARPVFSRRISLGRALVLRVICLAALLTIVTLARLTPRRFPPSDPSAKKPTLLFTYYPRSWVTWEEGRVDRYYGLLPDEVEKLGLSPVFVLMLADHLDLLTLRMAWERLLALRRDGPGMRRFLALEAYASIRHVLGLCLSINDIWQYRKMRRSPEFRQAFDWRGLDLTDLTAPTILRSIALDWPHMQNLQRCAEQIGRVYSPPTSWLHFFEYAGGRALIRGLKAGGSGTVFGMQHGPITPMRFSYAGDLRERQPSPNGGAALPEPDAYVVEGTLAQGILAERGVPHDRIVLAGALRLQQTWARAQGGREIKRPVESPVRVLVALGLHDFEFVLPQIWDALADDPSLRIVVKLHPKTLPGKVSQRPSAPRGAEVVMAGTQADIYQCMEESDIVIGAFSSVVFEAIVFGLPSIVVKSHRIMDLNRSWSREGLVLEASDAATLRAHVKRLAQDSSFRETYIQDLQGTIPRLFGPFDGRAAQRLAALCRRMTEEEPGHSSEQRLATAVRLGQTGEGS